MILNIYNTVTGMPFFLFPQNFSIKLNFNYCHDYLCHSVQLLSSCSVTAFPVSQESRMTLKQFVVTHK